MDMKKYCLFLFSLIILGCQTQKIGLEKLSKSKNDLLKPIFDNAEKYELQILYTQVNRKPNGEIEFIDFDYRVNDSAYFYPASSVKLPVAALALEKLRELRNSEQIGISRNSPYYIEGDSVKHSISMDIEAVFAISDNEAFNRLFEFLGQDHINNKLEQKGFNPVRISHRLSVGNALKTETIPLIFEILENSDTSNFRLPVINNLSAIPLNMKGIQKGNGFIQNDTLVDGAFDFSLKNYFPLRSQHQLMKQLMFPENFPENKRFNLDGADREFLLNAMNQLPREAGYDPEEYYDSYVKFFLYGDTKNAIPDEIKIYNKIGQAYGTLTETAYITNASKEVEFFLSATVLVNKNGVYNDNNYEYDGVGIPFFAALGREIYELELNRKK
jgi:beta-lactamase class A